MRSKNTSRDLPIYKSRDVLLEISPISVKGGAISSGIPGLAHPSTELVTVSV